MSQLNHNRRGERFQGYDHNLPPLVTADQLWNVFQVYHHSFTLLDSNQVFEESLAYAFGDISRCLPSDQLFEIELSKAFVGRIRTADEEILIRGRFHSPHQENNEFEKAWREAQASLQPTLAAEDQLGSFDHFVHRASFDTPYLLIGLNGPSLQCGSDDIIQSGMFASLATAGFTTCVVQWPMSMSPILEDFFQGRIESREALFSALLYEDITADIAQIDGWTGLAQQAKDHGVFLLALGMKESAMDIAACIQALEKPSAVFCHATEYEYVDGLKQALEAKGTTRTIALYKNITDFHDERSANMLSPSEYAYLREEDTVIAPYGRYGRDMPAHEDVFNIARMIQAQAREIEIFKERFTQFALEDGTETPLISAEDVIALADVYWVESTSRAASLTL